MAENVIREKVGYKRRLDGIQLPSELERLLRETLCPKSVVPPTRTVTGRNEPKQSKAGARTKVSFRIDLDRVASLHAESQVIEPTSEEAIAPNPLLDAPLVETDKLSGISTNGVSIHAPQKPTQKSPAKTTLNLNLERVAALLSESEQIENILGRNSANAIASEVSNTSEKALLTDLVAVRKLWRDLDNMQQRLIYHLFKHQPCSEDELKPHTLHGALVLVALDQINELSLTHLAEVVIRVENEQISLEEDFLDELQVVIRESTSLLLSLPNPSDAPPHEDIWQRFVAALTSPELALVKVLAQNAKAEAQFINELARSHQQMSTILIDQLSEKSIAILAHPFIYPDGDDWCVEEEDLSELRRVIHL